MNIPKSCGLTFLPVLVRSTRTSAAWRQLILPSTNSEWIARSNDSRHIFCLHELTTVRIRNAELSRPGLLRRTLIPGRAYVNRAVATHDYGTWPSIWVSNILDL